MKREDYNVWLDFYHLVPAEKWQKHIARAIQECQIFLLVVSKESISSKNVEYEWREALSLKKRIVLVIFEAAELPQELKRCEWIDFRKSFRRSVRELLVQFEHPVIQISSPPELGFKASRTVWAAFFVSIIAGALSIPAFWTVYIPYYLVPLPYRVLKRDFVFFNVQGVILALPIIIILNTAFIHRAFFDDASSMAGMLVLLSWLSVIICVVISPLMLILLRLPELRRWGKPMASAPVFSHSYKPRKTTFIRPMKISLEFAKEDRRYANSIIHALKSCGHEIIEDPLSAEAIIVLLSNFKKASKHNSEQRRIFPILLQDIDDIDPKLALIQWVDFRRGLRNLKYFCMLLPNPQDMLSALGITPMGRQVVLPSIIRALAYILSLLSGIAIGSSALSVILVGIYLEGDIFSEIAVPIISFILSIASAILMILARKNLILRRRNLANLLRLFWGLAGLLGMWLIQFAAAYASYIDTDGVERGDRLNYVGHLIQISISGSLLVGLGLCFVLCIWYWRDLSRWIPCRSK